MDRVEEAFGVLEDAMKIDPSDASVQKEMSRVVKLFEAKMSQMQSAGMGMGMGMGLSLIHI